MTIINSAMCLGFTAYLTVVGVSRFSFGVFIPVLQKDLGGSLSDYGSIGTIHFIGYFFGLVLIPLFRSRFWNSTNPGFYSLFVGIVMILSSQARGLIDLAAYRFVVGVASAFVAILVMDFTLKRTDSHRRGTSAAFVWAGASVGIGVCGLVSPIVLSNEFAVGWRSLWSLVGCCCVIVSVLFWLFPEQLKRTNSLVEPEQITTVSLLLKLLWQKRVLRWAATCYFFYGVGYIIYLTYLVPELIRQGVSLDVVALLWSGMGIAGALSGVLWGVVIDKINDRLALFTSLFIGAIASMTVVTSSPSAMIYGAIIFGSTAFIGPALTVNVIVRKEVKSVDYPSYLGVIVAIFALGQAIGPAFGGYISEKFGTNIGVVIASIILIISAVCSLKCRADQAS